MSNIDKPAQRTDMLIVNALETAKQLRELQESPVAEAIFESVVENENGKEIQFERPISDLAFAATWQLERLVEALEAAESRIAELEARTVNLPKRSVGEVMHMSGFSRDYAEGWCAGNDNAIHEIRAAGIDKGGQV